ncbi:MAG: DnaJ domain-containing protein [Candidatus Gastranaerophilales bacterium]|nr:DnaJ domain-containing protein [Candidatus Gastranaerophilales bacterium]
MLKSYYEILNIRDDATKQEIKIQYRKLVRMYHPDVNSSLEAEYIFKEINKAAEILLDDEKRKNYDALRAVNKNIYRKTDFKEKPKTSKKQSGYSFYDLFSKENKSKKTQEEKIKKPKNGEDITMEVVIDFCEALIGTNRTVNITNSKICPKCNGKKFANNQKCPYCDGLGEKIFNKKITVKIPPQIKNNAKLRILNEGSLGENGGKNGNLYIIVKIESNDDLKVKDGIVYYDAHISPYLAVLGGNVTVPTLWGEATIKIPPLTKSNQSFKLIDVGVLDEKTNKKGDEIVKIVIQIPTEITNEEYLLYEKLKEINSRKRNAKYT